ncbi:calcium ion antiporter [Aureococcus anophagefferens]|nr:calcium ion antiporter [Aureococcus anophagefferens]
MGSSPSKKYGAAEAPVQPPPKANKKYTAKKAIRVSSARLGAAVYEELYEDADPAEVLGRGRLGDVALARGRGERAGDAFAVRTLTTTNSSIEDMRRQMVVFEKLQREIHCDWLVPIASCCLGRGDEPRARVVFKRCAGEFLEVLSSEPHRSTFTEAAARDVVRKLATVLRQCHEAGFAHRQVRAEHVLAAGRGGGPPSPRLGGWGLAAPTDPEADDANVPDALNLAADLVYCAPELAGGCGRDDHDARRLRTHGGLDVWALGVFFHVLLFGKGPLFDVDDARCEDRAGVERRLAEAARRGGAGSGARTAQRTSLGKTVFEMAGIAAVTRIVGDANETFDGIDADASGKIDRDELEAFLRKEGCCDEQLSPEAMAKAVEDMDGNGNGEITREAFVKWYSTCEAQDGALKAIAEIKDGARASGVETAGIELTDKGSSLPASTDTVGFDEFKAWFATSEFFQAKSSQTKAVVEAAGDEEDGEGLSLSWPADASPAGTSVPDLLSSVIVARQGHGDMAVSSSPVLVCAGNLAISIMVLIGMICLVVGMINYNKWRMTKSMGNAMFVSHGFFAAGPIRVFLPNARRRLLGGHAKTRGAALL